MTRYPFDIDVGSIEGRLEVLGLWSRAQLDLSTAALIFKTTTADVLELASRHGVQPPSAKATADSIRALESKIRPQLRKAKRSQATKNLSEFHLYLSETLDCIASIALEAEAYGDQAAQQLYNVAHAELRRALDVVAAIKEAFDRARVVEHEQNVTFDYSDASLVALRDLDRVIPRPDYYLIGDFDHINPASERDILLCWSHGLLPTKTAVELMRFEEGDTINEIADQLEILLPVEEALLPIEAAAILGDGPVNGDKTFNVRRRIRDGRLPSYFPSDVWARKSFEERKG